MGARPSSRSCSAGELARHLGLPVPDQVLVELDAALAKAEPDGEIQDLLERSAGTNVGLDFLPGALAFAPAIGPAARSRSSRRPSSGSTRCHDNVDRTPRNPNLLVWHRRLAPDRPRVRAVHPPHLEGPGRARPPAVPAGPRPRAAAVRLVDRRGRRAAGAAGRPARCSRGSPRRSPTTGCPPRPGCPTPTPIARRTSTTSRPARGAAAVRRGGRSCPRSLTPARRAPFEYAIVRVMPRVERGEAFNAGIVLMCRPRRFLGARVALDERCWPRCRPDCDPAIVRRAPRRDRADRRRATPTPDRSPRSSMPERFHWLVAPSSTSSSRRRSTPGSPRTPPRPSSTCSGRSSCADYRPATRDSTSAMAPTASPSRKWRARKAARAAGSGGCGSRSAAWTSAAVRTAVATPAAA